MIVDLLVLVIFWILCTGDLFVGVADIACVLKTVSLTCCKIPLKLMQI